MSNNRDPFRHVRKGEKLKIYAKSYNAMLDAAVAIRNKQNFQADRSKNDPINSGVVKVKNCSGEPRERFDVLGVDVPMFLPSESENSFKNEVLFDGVMPSDPDHIGKFAILLEPLKENGIGLACISGVCPAWVEIPATGSDFKFAEMIDGDATALIAGQTGSTQIMWIDPDIAPGDSGWAVVRLGSAGAKENNTVLVKLIAKTGWDGTTILPSGEYRGRILEGSTSNPEYFPGGLTVPVNDDALVINIPEALAESTPSGHHIPLVSWHIGVVVGINNDTDPPIKTVVIDSEAVFALSIGGYTVTLKTNSRDYTFDIPNKEIEVCVGAEIDGNSIKLSMKKVIVLDVGESVADIVLEGTDCAT